MVAFGSGAERSLATRLSRCGLLSSGLAGDGVGGVGSTARRARTSSGAPASEESVEAPGPRRPRRRPERRPAPQRHRAPAAVAEPARVADVPGGWGGAVGRRLGRPRGSERGSTRCRNRLMPVPRGREDRGRASDPAPPDLPSVATASGFVISTPAGFRGSTRGSKPSECVVISRDLRWLQQAESRPT